MRFLDRLISFIYSLLFLMLAVVLILIGTGVIDPKLCLELLENNFLNNSVISKGIFNPITITGIVLLILSLKTTVFLSLFKVKSRAPISVKTRNGEVQITQETIINTAKNQTLEYENVREVQASMVKKSKGILIYETIQVYVNTNIRDLTEAIQESVKKIIYATTGVNVLDVNIKVRNVYNGKKKEEPSKTDEPEVKVESLPQVKEEVVEEANNEEAPENVEDTSEKETGDKEVAKEESKKK